MKSIVGKLNELFSYVTSVSWVWYFLGFYVFNYGHLLIVLCKKISFIYSFRGSWREKKKNNTRGQQNMDILCGPKWGDQLKVQVRSTSKATRNQN